MAQKLKYYKKLRKSLRKFILNIITNNTITTNIITFITSTIMCTIFFRINMNNIKLNFIENFRKFINFCVIRIRNINRFSSLFRFSCKIVINYFYLILIFKVGLNTNNTFGVFSLNFRWVITFHMSLFKPFLRKI